MSRKPPVAASRILTSAREVISVAGILIAFSLDAWWDERKEQREVRESLTSILGDLEASRDELDTVERANASFKARAEELLALDSGALASLSDVEVLRLAGPLGGGALTFDPVTGSLNAMIAGDRLYQIENAKLRSALAAWPALMDEIGEDQAIFIDMYLAQRNRAVELGLLDAGLDAPPRSSVDYARRALATALSDDLMRNRIAAHADAVDGLDQELDELGIQLDAVIRLLRQEVGEPAAERNEGATP